ncbi:cell division protein FtsQ/DivIB [Sinanaerobacter sp. ZZT-01]|uniref:cell division protein FtsQ/DivIB n=1 Tax=Sinanaerobacter sp. ZZT-01 TaxID=3111540 RepID=UPI002D78747B|nr:FtsQ-type POTRA domain-containing protein [Sinanaerobacter sp. ZZT-01]WRR93704.1 FtsQ-type POTRA domain-containing protein [Sinanaerobacter sp. ZZT-01]
MKEKKITNVKKPRKKKKRKKKRYLLKTFIFFVIMIGMYYFLTSSFFDIQKISVKENNYYTAEQIIRLSKIKVGKNIFKTSMGNAAGRMRKDPYMKNVKISRRLPSTIVITVEERKEYAVVPYGEEYLLMDEDGMALRKTDVAPTLPLLMGMTVKKMDPGYPLEVEENSVLTDTLKMLSAMEENEIYFKKIDISKVVIKAYIYDYLYCEGTPENIRENMDKLKSVLYKLYTQGIERGVIKMGSDGYFSFSPEIE